MTRHVADDLLLPASEAEGDQARLAVAAELLLCMARHAMLQPVLLTVLLRWALEQLRNSDPKQGTSGD